MSLWTHCEGNIEFSKSDPKFSLRKALDEIITHGEYILSDLRSYHSKFIVFRFNFEGDLCYCKTVLEELNNKLKEYDKRAVLFVEITTTYHA